MTRRHLLFDCQRARLVGTIDEGSSQTGLLIVTGGNEIRSGAFRGQAQLAARIAADGFPVFRFDRRGTGDSEGGNGEFASAGPDIAAALAAFRAEAPQLTRIFGYGNCDAASALMLFGGAGLDGLILSNPWTFEDGDDGDGPPAVIRDHYRRRLADPTAIKRLIRGEVSLRGVLVSLRDALRPNQATNELARQMAGGVERYSGPVSFLIAERDRTGQAFAAGWRRDDPRIRTCPAATHGYAEPHARAWLAEQVLEMLRA